MCYCKNTLRCVALVLEPALRHEVSFIGQWENYKASVIQGWKNGKLFCNSSEIFDKITTLNNQDKDKITK